MIVIMEVTKKKRKPVIPFSDLTTVSLLLLCRVFLKYFFFFFQSNLWFMAKLKGRYRFPTHPVPVTHVQPPLCSASSTRV